MSDNNKTTATAASVEGDKQWMIGNHYKETVKWTLDDIARRVEADLYNGKLGETLPAEAQFWVTADTAGPVPVLRTTMTSMDDPDDFLKRKKVMYLAFKLANHYNRVNLARPNECRFVQCVIAVDDDQRPVEAFVGMMSDVLPTLDINDSRHDPSMERATARPITLKPWAKYLFPRENT